MKNSVILFDVDRTLICSCRSHKKAFAHAFKLVYDTDAVIDAFDCSGWTDRAIVTGVLRQHGLADEAIIQGIERAFAVMNESFLEFVQSETITALPGVGKVVSDLANNETVLGLVTGNLEPIARAKLSQIGLDSYFELGGFGSLSVKRADLAEHASKLAFAKYPHLSKENTFLVGDTVRDIEAGKGAGLRTVGIAQWAKNGEQLRAAGADLVVDSWEDPAEFFQFIQRYQTRIAAD